MQGISAIAKIATLTIVVLLSGKALAEKLPTPQGPVVLTISGKINNHNNGDTAEFDIAMLEQLGTTTFTTNTPWIDEPAEFTGVRINALLAYVGAEGSDFRATALDKYWFDLKNTDFDAIPVIIAYKKNGKLLRVRDLGPLWIMFPFDDFPKSHNETNINACVWQLLKIDVQ